MRKKGILMPETLKIILAVLGIVILITLAVKMYNASITRTEIEQARFNLDIIERTIANLEEGSSQEYLLLSPKGWVLTTWPIKYSYYSPAIGPGANPAPFEYPESYIPNQCKKNNWQRCICFCSPPSDGQLLEACDKLAVCKNIKNELEKESPIYVDNLIDNKKPIVFSLNNGKLSFIMKK